MAGIGWKLQKLIDRGSLTGALGAYLTGVVVTSAPWLLTTGILTSLRLAARSRGGAEFAMVEQTVTLIYALTVLIGAPIQVVVSRYASDRLYDRHVEAIAAPLRRALAATLVGCGVLGALAMKVMEMSLAVAVPGTILTGVVGAQWLMLAVGGGLSSPSVVLRAFVLGGSVSVVGALGLERGLGLGALGYFYGFGLGQLVTLVLLIIGVARALPDDSDESARLGPAFLEYRLLAVAALSYQLSLWIDKVILWFVAGRDAAALYTATSAVAWFSVIPAFAWMYVQMETVFYQRFRAYFGAVEGGGTLHRLREHAAAVRKEASAVLRGAALVQAGVSVLVIMAAPLAVRAVSLPPEAIPIFRLTVVGAALQVTTLLAVLLLYYFDLRRDALAVSFVLLIAQGALTLANFKVGLPLGFGSAAASAVACALGIVLVRRRMSTLLVDTFQSQPFGAM